MPKEILNLELKRASTNQNWGIVLVGGKEKGLTIKIGKVRALSPAEVAGVQSGDFIWQINGKEVFEMEHEECVQTIKKSGQSMSLAVERYFVHIFFDRPRFVVVSCLMKCKHEIQTKSLIVENF